MLTTPCQAGTPRRRSQVTVGAGEKQGAAVSAAAFESGCASPLLAPARDTTGYLSFLTTRPDNFGASRDRQRYQHKLHQAGQAGLSNIPDLHTNLTSDLNQASLAFKIAKNLCLFSRAVSVSILQVRRSGQKIFLSACALNIRPGSTFLSDQTQNSINFSPIVAAALAEVIHTGESQQFSKLELDTVLGAATAAVTAEECSEVRAVGLLDAEGAVRGVALLSFPDPPAVPHNPSLVTDIAKLAGICLKNASEFQTMQLELTRSQVFLELARIIFDNQSSVEFTVLKMLANFLMLIQCERAQLLLSDRDAPTTFRKVYDLEEADLDHEDFDLLESPYENRFPLNSGVTGLVAALGETVNIGDTSCHEIFDHALDDDAHFEHRSLLCMPIRDSDNKIIGVVSLINKKSGSFNDNDEKFVEAFGLFCGISLANAWNYEQLKTAEARKQVALDIMTYHASSGAEETAVLSRLTVPPAATIQLQSFSFTDSQLEDMDTLTVSKLLIRLIS